MINSPRRQDATQRTGRSDQQGLPAQRRKIIHDRLIGPYRNSQQEQKKKNCIRNRLTDLLQQFYFTKEIPDGNAAEHDSDYCKHPFVVFAAKLTETHSTTKRLLLRFLEFHGNLHTSGVGHSL